MKLVFFLEMRKQEQLVSGMSLYSTPKDKRRHMLLVHSGKNYLTCPHCPMILLSKTAMEKHIEEYHGSSDLRQQICDLCFHQFKSANNLRIHRFNHENYFCRYSH